MVADAAHSGNGYDRLGSKVTKGSPTRIAASPS